MYYIGVSAPCCYRRRVGHNWEHGGARYDVRSIVCEYYAMSVSGSISDRYQRVADVRCNDGRCVYAVVARVNGDRAGVSDRTVSFVCCLRERGSSHARGGSKGCVVVGWVSSSVQDESVLSKVVVEREEVVRQHGFCAVCGLT